MDSELKMAKDHTFVLDKIFATYPELVGEDIYKLGIHLCDDSDGEPIYIEKWSYSKPIPDGLKLGK